MSIVCEVDLASEPPADVVVTLSACRHRSCKSCMAKWIEREEASGQDSCSCPFCRSTIVRDDLLAILGRPFQPRQASLDQASSSNNEEQQMDDLTRQWMSEHTVPCRGCGSLIEKESGCDLIECLCGFRFCYSCGKQGGVCGCNPNHHFLNERNYIDDAPVRVGRSDSKYQSLYLTSTGSPGKDRTQNSAQE